jgi:hypothetical protein
MNKWHKSILALAVLAGIAVFSHVHSSNHPSNGTSLTKSAASVRPNNQSKVSPEPDNKTREIESKEFKETTPVPFQTIKQEDPSMPEGTSSVVTQGVNGVKIITYKVIYSDGIESGRQKISEEITTQPVNQVTKVGTAVALRPAEPSGPAGATALCIDGFLSYALHHQGACSKHGGVRLWYTRD